MRDPIVASQFIRTWHLLQTVDYSIANHVVGGFADVGMHGQGEDLLAHRPLLPAKTLRRHHTPDRLVAGVWVGGTGIINLTEG